MKKQKKSVSKGSGRMDNKKALEYININDHLLNDYGNIQNMVDEAMRKKAMQKIFKSVNGLQGACTHPYVMVSHLLDGEVEYTCLVCGRMEAYFPPEVVINAMDGTIIEDENLEEEAVKKLKSYLMEEPSLSEEEIRENLRKDMIVLGQKR